MSIVINVDEARVRIKGYGALLSLSTPRGIKRDVYEWMHVNKNVVSMYSYVTKKDVDVDYILLLREYTLMPLTIRSLGTFSSCP